jgi:hypothetical protein
MIAVSSGWIGASKGLFGASKGWICAGKGLFGASKGLVRADKGLFGASNGLVRADKGLFGASNGLVRADKGLFGASKGWIRPDKGLFGASKGWIRADNGPVAAMQDMHRRFKAVVDGRSIVSHGDIPLIRDATCVSARGAVWDRPVSPGETDEDRFAVIANFIVIPKLHCRPDPGPRIKYGASFDPGEGSVALLLLPPPFKGVMRCGLRTACGSSRTEARPVGPDD